MNKYHLLLVALFLLFGACSDGEAISPAAIQAQQASLNSTETPATNITNTSVNAAQQLIKACPTADSCRPQLPAVIRKLDPDILLAASRAVNTSTALTTGKSLSTDDENAEVDEEQADEACLSGGAISVQCVTLSDTD